jgi:hypothetical protein
VLSLLSEVAEEHPLLCVVDDAQWLDQASALTLAFVARRLQAEPVGMVFAAREPGEELGTCRAGGPGLVDGDARALLARRCGFVSTSGSATGSSRRRGQPARPARAAAWADGDQLAGGFGMPARDALPGGSRRASCGDSSRCRGDARLCCSRRPSRSGIRSCSGARPSGSGSAGGRSRREGDGLLVIGERVMFRHPLVRSAMYRAAPAEERRARPSGAGGGDRREADPDRRAWHLAAAAAGPDEQVASELERSAGRAQARGGLAAAAAFLQRAVALTGDPARRADRRSPPPRPACRRARSTRRAGCWPRPRSRRWTSSSAPAWTCSAPRPPTPRPRQRGARPAPARGEDARPLDPQLARDTYLDAWSSALFAGRLASSGSLRHVSRAALAAPGRGRAASLRSAAEGLRARVHGRPRRRGAGAPAGGDRLRGQRRLGRGGARWGWLATAAAADGVGLRHVPHGRRARGRGRPGGGRARRPRGQRQRDGAGRRARRRVRHGRGAGREAEGVTEATGTQVAPYGAWCSPVSRGGEDVATRLIDAQHRGVHRRRAGHAVQYAHWARSLLLNGHGRYREALAAAEEASDDTPELFVAVWAAVEALEAAVECGERERRTGRSSASSRRRGRADGLGARHPRRGPGAA